jgi:hypothetical protein
MRIVKCDGRETLVEDRDQTYRFDPNESFEEIARSINRINSEADAVAKFRHNLPDLMQALARARTVLAEAQQEALRAASYVPSEENSPIGHNPSEPASSDFVEEKNAAHMQAMKEE